jgi:hypothetical protein
VIILSIDPGLASGIALINTDAPPELMKMGSWEMAPAETEDAVDQAINAYKDDFDLRVVVERFTITAETGKKSQGTWSLELIGSIKYICRINGMPMPTLQTPADAKNFVPNPRLKALSLWHKGGHGHALDALRHAVLYAVKNGYRDKRLLLE